MIQYIKRKNIDVAKYDACIANSIQSRIYAFSWYLDIVADNWDVLVLDDYKAVMPIPWRKKFGIKYTYTPLRVLELGIFSTEEVHEIQFVEKLKKYYKFIHLRLNYHNKTLLTLEDKFIRHQQILNLNIKYEIIFNNYRKDRKKDLKKAEKNQLYEKWNDSEDNLITLFKNNIGLRFDKISEADYTIMKKLLQTCIAKNCGQVLSIYSKENELVASGFFVKHKEKVTILFSSTNLKNRKNGANTFLIDRAIFHYKNDYKTFGFGGSSIESIASFFKSFGAHTEEYADVYINNLPYLLKFLKK